MFKINKIKTILITVFPLLLSMGTNNAYAGLSFSVDDQEINVANELLEKQKKMDSTLKNSKNSESAINKSSEKYKQVKQETVKTINEKSPLKTTLINKTTKTYNPKIVGRIEKGDTCWDGAAKYHRVDPWLLYSIAYVESRFNPNAVGKNKNGTRDLGMMQINDKVWLPKLAKMGISKDMLKDPCVSVYVGAWILRQNIDEFGYTAKAIGAYNSRTPVHNKNYARKVYDAYAKFTKLHKIQTAQN